MAKYVIEIPDSEETMWEGFNGDLFIPITMNKGTRTWVNTDLKMTPYTEPDRKAIEDEVWEFSMKTDFAWISEVGDKPLGDYSYQEAKAKYDAWKKKKDKIRVGDEVEYECDGIVRFVVFGIVGNIAYGFKYPCDYDDVGEYCDIDMLTKTGRHFDEIENLIKKMRG